jgi:LPXTG-motif cell wall-anchored protein
MTDRRGLTVAVLAVAAGAGLVLLGASRVWWVEVVPRPAPLRPEEIAHTGSSLAPLLPALGLVALAGAGGLLATRRAARRLVGALLGVVAVALVVTVAGAIRGAGPVWPAACLAGAALIGLAGGLAVGYGGRWPEMGARYRRNRPDAARAGATQESGAEGAPAGGDVGAGPSGPATVGAVDATTVGRTGAPTTPHLSTAELWDAVDRGDDPTRD